MERAHIVPHKITKPIQLLAVWLTGLILLVGSFLTAAVLIREPSWLPPLFGIGALLIVILFSALSFLMQTRFRPQLQDDPYYAEYLKYQQEQFKNFRPENIASVGTTAEHTEATARDLEERRIKRYQENRGLFLVHTWRPSRIPGQVADIAISLHQHGKGPLTERKVRIVEYQVGPKFFDHPVRKKNDKENFKLNLAAYGPMLCLAKVEFTDAQPPLLLERYINF